MLDFEDYLRGHLVIANLSATPEINQFVVPILRGHDVVYPDVSVSDRGVSHMKGHQSIRDIHHDLDNDVFLETHFRILLSCANYVVHGF